MSKFFKKLWLAFRFLAEELSSKQPVGGLQISDSAILYVSGDGEFRSFSLRLPPGVVREGKIQLAEQLLEALKKLHDIIEPDNQRANIPVTVSLPYSSVYSQSFNIPNIGRDKLENSADLNLKMISPIPPEKAYASWEELSETEDRFDLLGAFAEKSLVDGFLKPLSGSGFSVVAMEFPGLSLARVVNLEASPEILRKPVLVLQITSDGLYLSVIRPGGLYFDYFRSWLNVQGENPQISKTLFESTIREEVQKVANFSLSKFKEDIETIILIAPGFENTLTELLNEFGFKVVPLQARNCGNLSPGWYVPLGAALRDNYEATKKSINLAPFSSGELFFYQRMFGFVKLWRNVAVAVFSVLLLAFALMSYSVEEQHKFTAEREAALTLAEEQDREISLLESRAKTFNALVSEIGRVKMGSPPWHGFLVRIGEVAGAGQVTVERMNITSLDNLLSLVARAPSEAAIIRFKDILDEEADFTDISLRIATIDRLADGTVRFKILFRWRP